MCVVQRTRVTWRKMDLKVSTIAFSWSVLTTLSFVCWGCLDASRAASCERFLCFVDPYILNDETQFLKLFIAHYRYVHFAQHETFYQFLDMGVAFIERRLFLLILFIIFSRTVWPEQQRFCMTNNCASVHRMMQCAYFRCMFEGFFILNKSLHPYIFLYILPISLRSNTTEKIRIAKESPTWKNSGNKVIPRKH
jgi:hypothetical protein